MKKKKEKTTNIGEIRDRRQKVDELRKKLRHENE